jgi:hypothetical protein
MLGALHLSMVKYGIVDFAASNYETVLRCSATRNFADANSASSKKQLV